MLPVKEASGPMLPELPAVLMSLRLALNAPHIERGTSYFLTIDNQIDTILSVTLKLQTLEVNDEIDRCRVEPLTDRQLQLALNRACHNTSVLVYDQDLERVLSFLGLIKAEPAGNST